MSGAACRRSFTPPYSFAFTIDGSPPHVLEASREITVEVGLTNTGEHSWDPARIHLSYHWLSFIPREIVARSRWDVPYHNGIRTDIGDAFPTTTRRVLQGRLIAPDWPGLYWLQWDMVDEGATWFSQVSPRQSRTLVLVLPPPLWVAAPLPFLIALFGLRAAGRGTRFGTVADAVWCSAVLACKPIFVIDDALLEPTVVGYWLMLATALMIPALALLLLPRRVRAWTMFAAGVLGSLFALADVLYYRFFGDVLSAPAVLAAGQTGHVWGSIRSLLSFHLIWIVIDWPFAAWLAYRVSRLPAPRPSFAHRVVTTAVVAALLVVSGATISVPSVLRAAPLDQMFRDRAIVEELGLWGFHTYDFWNYARTTWFRRPATDVERGEALDWFAARTPLRAGPPAASYGIARGRNLIVVQVESLQDFMVDFTVDGQEVMPHLRRWTADSLRFTNVTDETNEGRTSDAEFTTLTSLLPLDHGAVAFRYPANHYVALPRVLAEHGYSTASAVAFEAGFWNRRVMHPAYGFQRSFFEPDFDLTEQIGWGLNDRDFLQQMLPRLSSFQQPFAAWLITLSLHHPFDDFPAKHKVLRLGKLEGTSFGNYIHTMHFFDEALDAFKAGLASRGLLDSSVIVVFGDHDAGFSRTPEMVQLMGISSGIAAWIRNDRVPLFVRVPRGKDGTPAPSGAQAVVAGQTDLAPTLLSLFGIDAARLPYVGRNLLGPSATGPVVRPFGEWLDARHLFLTDDAQSICVDNTGREMARQACDAADEDARRAREISRRVVVDDLQTVLRPLLAQGDGEPR